MPLTDIDLRSADVLLYRGEGIVSRLIRFFDRSEVNHAGLWLGDGRVGEALAQGVVPTPLAASIEDATRVRVRRLTAPVATTDPVLARGKAILDEGHRYGFEQIALLALLSLTRRLKASPVLRALLRRILDDAAAWLVGLGGGGGARQPMICSEFVYRCYDEALPDGDDVYTLSIDLATPRLRGGPAHLPRGRGIEAGSILEVAQTPAVRAVRRSGPPPATTGETLAVLGARYLQELPAARSMDRLSPADVADLAPSLERFAEAWQAAAAPGAAPPGARARGEPALDVLARAAADFVTPGDLLKSPSLFEVGDLKGGD